MYQGIVIDVELNVYSISTQVEFEIEGVNVTLEKENQLLETNISGGEAFFENVGTGTYVLKINNGLKKTIEIELENQ